MYESALALAALCVEKGHNSLRHLFTAVLESDIPFAQDCFGDQFLIRDGRVVRLWSETGQVDPMEMTFHEFFSNAENDPMTFLSNHCSGIGNREGYSNGELAFSVPALLP